MQLGWVDYSRQERETIKELLKVLGESSSLDELGVGIVRDSISDLLYPGTSVLHTRAKYYILVPELFKKAMKSGLTTGSEVRRLIDSDQDAIARALRRAIDEETGTKAAGIIGGRSDRAVKMKPTRIPLEQRGFYAIRHYLMMMPVVLSLVITKRSKTLN